MARFNPIQIIKKGRLMLVWACLLQSSCYKDLPCERVSLYPGFSGYDMDDVAGAKIFYYSLDKTNPYPFDSLSPTPKYWKNYILLLASKSSYEGFEMEVIIPKRKKRYRISNIVWQNNTRRCRNKIETNDCKGGPCTSPPTQCTVDGKVFKIEDYLNENKVVIIPK